MPHYNVVGALVMREGKVLAARRGASKYEYVAHKFEFVGGKIEPGETASCVKNCVFQRGFWGIFVLLNTPIPIFRYAWLCMRWNSFQSFIGLSMRNFDGSPLHSWIRMSGLLPMRLSYLRCVEEKLCK